MYCLYVGFDYTYIDVNALAQGINPFWPHMFGFKPLLRLANHSATKTSLCMYVYIYIILKITTNINKYIKIKNKFVKHNIKINFKINKF